MLFVTKIGSSASLIGWPEPSGASGPQCVSLSYLIMLRKCVLMLLACQNNRTEDVEYMKFRIRRTPRDRLRKGLSPKVTQGAMRRTSGRPTRLCKWPCITTCMLHLSQPVPTNFPHRSRTASKLSPYRSSCSRLYCNLTLSCLLYAGRHGLSVSKDGADARDKQD
jgi:hypothetical protein